MTEAQRAELLAMRKALDGLVGKIAGNTAEINENMVAVRQWEPGAYVAGDVRMYGGMPYKCIQAHDSTGNSAWNPADVPALWMQYHGTSAETARPWIAPTGAHDAYRAGEYMVWNDGNVYKCMTQTNFSPTEYPQAWVKVTEV